MATPRSARSIYVTMIRHGESCDNVTALWAGQRDAPLTNHGYNQSMALAKAFTDVPITAIYASDLARALTTAKNVLKLNRTDPPPPLTVSPLLREQFFGVAEGSPWDAGKYSSTHLPWEDHRAFELAAHAESLNEVGARADWVLREFVLPHLLLAAKGGEEGENQHILLVAHGIWLSEMMFAFKRAEDPSARFVKTSSYSNTGWSRLEVEIAGDGDATPTDTAGELERPKPNEQIVTPAAPSEAASSRADATKSASSSVPIPEHIAALRSTLPNVPGRHDTLPPPHPQSASLNDPSVAPDFAVPRLRVEVLATNQAQHLEGLTRTKGGVGSSKWDDSQRTLKEMFFGGASAPKSDRQADGKREGNAEEGGKL